MIRTALALALLLAACNSGEVTEPVGDEAAPEELPDAAAPEDLTDAATSDEVSTEIPLAKPDDWDPLAFNMARGATGSIPEIYMAKIHGEDGMTAHLGKHLPYVPGGVEVPEGHLALMWGDPALGNAKHPNAPVGTEGYERGHWYDWVRVRKSTADDAPEAETLFDGWPELGDAATGTYQVLGEGEITDEGGKNTVYVVRLPEGVASGDVVRVHAHCLYHGEYVDFVTVP